MDIGGIKCLQRFSLLLGTLNLLPEGRSWNSGWSMWVGSDTICFACLIIRVSSSVPPFVCREPFIQGHRLINDGRISVSVSPTQGLHQEDDPHMPHTSTQNLLGTHSVMRALRCFSGLSRDRLAVTQRCPPTSDLPESYERADPWLTTEIQLPNQAGRQKCNFTFTTHWPSIQLAPFL